MSDPALEDVASLTARLRAMRPRPSQALVFRLVEGRSRAECAALYGVSPEAFDVKLWRALQECLHPEGAPLAPDEAEREAALELGVALERESAPQRSGVAGAWGLARGLRAQGDELRRALEAAARADEASPARRREEWLRRAAIVAIIVLTAFFYLRSKA